MNNLLKEYRELFNISQVDAALASNISLRTYIRYEADPNYGKPIIRESIINSIKNKYQITEEKGLLNLDIIKKVAKETFDGYEGKIEFAYLFGSYAKGYFTERSDVDILISTSLTGFSFVGVSERLREKLHKKIDLFRLTDEFDNKELLTVILKDGIKIYG